MVVAGGDERPLEYTPTWVVALVCFSIVFISITVDRLYHYAGQRLKKHKSWPLISASRKIEDELMLLGLISLLLTVIQNRIGKICISERLDNLLLPCKKPDWTTSDTKDYCSQKGRVPLLSVEAVHQLHIFIFVLATFHVVLCMLKVLSMIMHWGLLEIYDTRSKNDDIQTELRKIRKHYENPLNSFKTLLMSSLQKGFTSLTEYEYIALRQNFIAARDPKDPMNDFQKYIMRTLQKDFEKMIRISWYSWLIAVVYLLVNVAGWNAYFWISFIPFTILFIIAIKLESIIMQLVKMVVEKHTQNDNESSEIGAKEMDVAISDDYFWFGRPGLVGSLIHIVLFVNSLELAFFFFILFQYGFHSCIMGKVGFVVPRIIIGVFVQVLCMSRTLPLYAIIESQMHLKKQLDKKNKICKIKMHLEEYLLDEHIKKCLDDLDEIKIPLKENGMDEEEEMWIVTWISELIDNRKNRRKEPNSPEESTNIEPTRTGSREVSVGDEIAEAGGVDSVEDIEAQNRQP